MIKLDQVGSRQMPKDKKICSHKDYYDILYAYLQCESEGVYNTQTEKVELRLYEKKKLNFSKLAEKFGVSRQTISKRFKKLQEELGLIVEQENYPNHYVLKVLPKDQAALIPYDTLKILTDALSENAISIYIYLLNRYFASNNNIFQFTLADLKKYIGICATTRSNDDIITNILFILQKIGLIRYSLTGVKQEDSFENIKTIYQLDWITNYIGQ